MESTLQQIKQSLNRKPRKIVIIYQNPLENNLFVNSNLFSHISICFILNRNKNKMKYGT